VSEFHDMLTTAVGERKTRRGQSIRAVAAEVGGHFSTLANAMKGTIRPPAELLDGWSQLFEDEDDRRRFVRLGHLEHATPQILAIVKGLERELAELRTSKTASPAAIYSEATLPPTARFKLPTRTPK